MGEKEGGRGGGRMGRWVRERDVGRNKALSVLNSSTGLM